MGGPGSDVRRATQRAGGGARHGASPEVDKETGANGLQQRRQTKEQWVRKRLAALLAGLATAASLAGTSPVPAGAQAVSDQAFGGYGSGATLSVNVLGLLGSQVLNVQAAAAGQSTNSQALPAAGLNNELGYNIQPGGLGTRNAYGRGTGLEVGVLTSNPNPDPNQILLAGLAEAAAPPNSGLVVEQIGPVALGGTAYANLLRGRAQATFDRNNCVIGKPLSFGEGEAAGLQLVGTPSGDGTLMSPLVGASLPPNSSDPRNVSRTRSVTYLRPNGDGTFGVVSETRQTIAPVSLLNGAATLELLGEWALRAIATGQPGTSRVEYAPVGAGPSTPVATLAVGGTTVLSLTTQDLFGTSGLDLGAALGALDVLLDVTIGTPARALGGTGAPQIAADGTSVSAAVDAVKIGVLTIPGLLTGADIRVGHMEASATAPPGGVRCNIPVSKVGTPDPVNAGQDFTITIRIPSDTAAFEELFGCDLVGIRVSDVHGIESGSPSFVLTGASDGGVIGGDGTTVTWNNIGDYRRGDPPRELTVTGRIPGSSRPGVLRDTADVTATLGNCDGTGAGEDIVGQAIGGGLVIGAVTLIGPDVGSGVLAATGGDGRLLVLGGGFVLGALALRRRLGRRAVSA